MLGLLLLSTALPAARLEATLPTPSAPGAAFARFKAAYSKSYAPHEEPHRLARFEASLREIDAINGADRPWRAGLNQFADLSWEEFQSSVLMAAQNCSATGRAVGGGHAKRLSAPPAIDWRDYKALNAVKNQAACGSCWTFSTTGCLEAHVFLKSGHMPNISEQQLVDCAGAFNNNGCNGGLPSQAYEYIRYAGGIDSEDAYPYVAKTGAQCGFKGAGVVAKVRQVVNITERDEAELEDAVGTVGPVSIAFEVAEDFRFYKSGEGPRLPRSGGSCGPCGPDAPGGARLLRACTRVAPPLSRLPSARAPLARKHATLRRV